MITHIIYISIIAFLFFWLCRAYDFANRKHHELIRYKDQIRVPFEILSHYDKAYVEFHKWMKENKISHRIINMFDKMFKYTIRNNKNK